MQEKTPLSYHWLLLVSFIVISTHLLLAVAYVNVLHSVLSFSGIGVIIAWLSWQLSKLLKYLWDLCSSHVDPAGKAVLVTGCSSGFGYQLTVRLDALGFRVIGCCRNINAPNVHKLKQKCSDKLQVIRMDVSSDKEVEEIRLQFQKLLSGCKLWAVVNNAGIGALHGIEWGHGMKLFDDCVSINTLGVVRVSRAFLPFLRQSIGSRLVIVTSIEDRIEPLTQPAYAASKFATRAFANACRRELRDMGVHVSVIAPAFFATELTQKENLIDMLQKNWADSSPEVRAAYGEDKHQMFVDFTLGTYSIIHKDITPVVDAMADAVSKSCQPKFHQRIGGLAELLVLSLVDILPEELVDAITSNALVIPQLKFIMWFQRLFHKQ